MNRLGTPREAFVAFIELFALSGLLIAQPVLDFIGDNAREMIALRLSTGNVVAFVLLLLLVPPLAIWLVELAVGFAAPRIRSRFHAGVTCILLGVLAGNYLKVSTHVGAIPRIAVSLAVAVAVGFFVIRSSALRQWLRFLAIAPLIFALLFVTASPASILLFQDAKAANVTIAHPARVIMIVFDEFPEESLLDGNGHVDAGLFPNFAKLAGDSTWYRNDTTVAEYTARAVPAILTGKLPALDSSLPIASKFPQSLFTLLAKTYTMHAHEFYEQLCPVSMCDEPTFQSPLHNLIESSSRVMSNLMDLDRTSWDANFGFRFGFDLPPGFEPALTVGRDFLTSLQPSNRPTLDYLHLLLPHEPWRYVGPGNDHGLLNPPLSYLTAFPRDANSKYGLGRQMHLLNLQATDWYLGQVMSKLKAIGAYDNSLIVATADHGVGFPYHRYATQAEYDSIMWTPLFIKAPHQGSGQQVGGRIDDRPVRSIDVLPTMADILGVKIPWRIDGTSVLGASHPERPVTLVHNDIGAEGVRQSFNARAGFARVLRSRAAPPGGDPALRLYRLGIYGSMVGGDVGSIARGAGPQLHGTLSTPGGWDDVDPKSSFVPWTAATGTVPGVKGGTVAIAVNGRIAGLAAVTTGGRYYAMLAPKFFRAGKNDVAAYLVSGLPSSPRLTAIAEGSPQSASVP